MTEPAVASEQEQRSEAVSQLVADAERAVVRDGEAAAEPEAVPAEVTKLVSDAVSAAVAGQ